MTECYHDQQDFKPDLNIEVAIEGDILQEGHNLDEIDCQKNPGHRDFIPFKDLALEHLPFEIRSREMLDNIKMRGSSVVRLVVDKIKNGKLIREAGSGKVIKIDNEYFIKTNNHVVKTDDDVKHCTVEFHYDGDSLSNVLTSSGVKLADTCPYRDITFFTFHPIPDFKYQRIWMDEKNPDTLYIMYKNNHIETLTFYIAHLSSKCVGSSHLDLNSSGINLMFVSCRDDSISYIKSSCFKFQLIPSNIQKLASMYKHEFLYGFNNSIEIHIDEDDGNSRVIPGNFLKCGDEFVVKISESIFQDEVKKSRILWNGEVIGRGTRLYFRHVTSRQMYSGIDLDLRVENGMNNIWSFECHPVPRGVFPIAKYPNKLCCIGHPHGGIKMITFGRCLGESLERFDNQYRHITQPGKDCKCKEVCVQKYSCKTCPGSSGSSVFYLYQEMNSSVSFNHFMGESVEEFLPDGELIENINMAWAPLQKEIL